MKKCITFLLIAALCLLLSVSALAENVSGKGGLVAESDILAAYLDGAGNLLVPGNDEPINERPADSIISIDPYRIVFMSRTDAGAEAEQTALVSIDLSTFEERVLDNDVYAACMTDANTLYYIPAVDRTQLYAVDFEHDIVRVAYSSAEFLDSLFVTTDGLVATYVENAGAVIYITATDSFEPYGDVIPVKSVMTGEYQVYIADGSTLYLNRPDSLAADAIDMNVYDFELLGGKIYYLANTGSALRLKVYDPVLLEQKVVCTPDIGLEDQLVSSGSSLFVLGEDCVVYRVNQEISALEPFMTIQNPVLADGFRVDSYSIEAMSGMLNVYAHITESAEEPEFTFIEFSSDIEEEGSTEAVLIHRVLIEGEETAWTLLEPAEQYSPLSKGSRGEAVSAIQQPLFDHGYYDYYIDGIFGFRTDNAVRLLQGDLGLYVNGIADADLQKLILSGNFPQYDPYLQQNRGDRGLRVQRMQQRLRSLGYLADGADGIFGGRTQAAIELFQMENNLPVNGSATRETLIKLYSASVARCTSYIDLRAGDTGYRVRELNKRLKELFYLEGSVDDTYTAETTDAIRRFQAQVGLAIDGAATPALQQRLFAPGAPECSGYIELRRGDENIRVTRLQRRLKELNYFHGSVTGYFGRQTQEAVKLFQQKVGIRPTGIATVLTQELLFSPAAPIYIRPTVIGMPAIAMDVFDKRDGGIFYLTDRSSETGYVTFSWAAEGEVAEYNISITDDKGVRYLDKNTRMTMTSVPVSTLGLNTVYTLQVVAYPADGSNEHVTSDFIRFCRIEYVEAPDVPQVGTITAVYATVEPVTRYENDVNYVRPGTVTFRWYAEGDVASYYVAVLDSNGNICLETTTSDEQASVRTNMMKDGELYTLRVCAIPTNGTMEDAVMKECVFGLDDELVPVPTVTAPVITVENTVADANGVYIMDGESLTLAWNAVENASQYYIEIRDANNVFIASDTTTATGYMLTKGSLAAGMTCTVTVTAIPVGGTVEDGAASDIQVSIPQEEQIIQLAAPALSITGVQPSTDGIAYVEGTAMVFQWTSVEGAAAYNVVVRDSNGTICHEMTLNQLNTAFDASGLNPDALYTVFVTAVPAEGVNAQGTAASQPFIFTEKEAPAEEPAVVIPEPEIPAAESESEVIVEEEVTEEAPAEESIPKIPEVMATVEVGAPEITVSPIAEVIDNVVYVQEGTIAFGWHSNGNISEYYAEIIDEHGNIRTQATTANEGASLPSENMEPDCIYTIRVVAIPAGGTIEEGAASEVRFAKRGAEEVIEETPVEEEITETVIPEEEPAAEESSIEEPAAEEPEQPVELPEEIVEQPVEEPAAIISAPVIGIQPALETVDSVTYVPAGLIQMNWSAEGAVAGYHVEILDAGNVIAQMDTGANATEVSSEHMMPGVVYTLRVTAVPANGNLEEGIAGEIRFALEQSQPVEEIYEEPAYEEPVEEIYEEPVYEEPVEEIYEEPVYEEPVEEIYEEPVYEEPAEEIYDEPVYEEPIEEIYEEPVYDESIDGSYTEPDVGVPAEEYLDSSSDPEKIYALQQRLIELNWLAPGSFTDGILDEATILGVMSFQNDYNMNFGGNLMPINFEMPVVDAETLNALMN